MTAVRSEGAALDVQFRRLAALRDGWYDGAGVAPPASTLVAARACLDAEALPRPHLYPIEEGGVRAEWSTRTHEVSVEWTETGAYLHALDMGTCEDDEEATGDQVVVALRKLLIP